VKQQATGGSGCCGQEHDQHFLLVKEVNDHHVMPHHDVHHHAEASHPHQRLHSNLPKHHPSSTTTISEVHHHHAHQHKETSGTVTRGLNGILIDGSVEMEKIRDNVQDRHRGDADHDRMTPHRDGQSAGMTTGPIGGMVVTSTGDVAPQNATSCTELSANFNNNTENQKPSSILTSDHDATQQTLQEAAEVDRSLMPPPSQKMTRLILAEKKRRAAEKARTSVSMEELDALFE